MTDNDPSAPLPKLTHRDRADAIREACSQATFKYGPTVETVPSQEDCINALVHLVLYRIQMYCGAELIRVERGWTPSGENGLATAILGVLQNDVFPSVSPYHGVKVANPQHLVPVLMDTVKEAAITARPIADRKTEDNR